MQNMFVVLLAALTGCAFAQPAGAAGDAFKETVLYSFCGQGACVDGAGPYAGLIAANGRLYGTTECGGTGNCTEGGGTLFSLDLRTGREKVLYNFCSRQNCADGYAPEAGLIDVNGKLYGTTFLGGASPSGGTVFALDRDSGTETVLHSFSGGTDGQYPQAGLIQSGGVLYGMTMGGGDDFGCGSYGCGTIFSVDLKTGTVTTLYAFCGQQNCADGGTPLAGLTDVNGTLYGTTEIGGTNGEGTVFSFNPATRTETVVYSFGGGSDGQYPWSGLLASANGTLFGTTYRGGTTGYGTVFALDLKTGTEAVLYSFCSKQGCADGANPTASLVHGNGILYGTTSVGGTSSACFGGCGTVFSLDRRSGTETVLHSFCSKANCADGESPAGRLLYRHAEGLLYGTTFGGGAHGCQSFGCGGTVFAISDH